MLTQMAYMCTLLCRYGSGKQSGACRQDVFGLTRMRQRILVTEIRLSLENEYSIDYGDLTL